MRRKTRFPTGVATSATKAKPPAAATAFCIFVVTLFNIRSCGICRRPADFPAVVTPTANRNSYRVTRGAYRPRRILLVCYHRMGVHIRAHHSVQRWQYNNSKTNKPQLVSSLSPWGEPEGGFPRCPTQAAETPTELPGVRTVHGLPQGEGTQCQ